MVRAQQVLGVSPPPGDDPFGVGASLAYDWYSSGDLLLAEHGI